MEEQRFVIKNDEQMFKCTYWLRDLDIPEGGVLVKIEPYTSGRTLSQNALFWLWMTYLVEIDAAKSCTITKEDWHDYFVSKFLGWTPARKIGSTWIEPTLKHTSDLLRQPMTDFMMQVEAFCAERNIYLPIPENAVYLKYRNSV